jgi:hypothetical protein
MKLNVGMQRVVTALLLVSLMPVICGCESVKDHSLTARAWDENMNSVYRPALDTHIQFFQKPDLTDVLVRYDEEREKSGALHPRAYFVLANESRTLARKKPHFVRPDLADAMRPIPFNFGTNGFSAPVPPGVAGFSAVLSADGLDFNLFRDGRLAGSYPLPVYVDRRSQLAMLLEAPGTLTVDAVASGLVVGAVAGVLYVYARANPADGDRGW